MRSTCSVSRNKGTKDYQLQLWSEQQFDSSLHEMMLWRTPQRNASYSLVISISQMPAPAESRQCLPLRSTDILCLQPWPLLPSNTPWRRQSGIIVVIVWFLLLWLTTEKSQLRRGKGLFHLMVYSLSQREVRAGMQAEPGGGNSSRAHRGRLLPGLLSSACSACFFTSPGPLAQGCHCP